jgi:CheY-like chemotaxis protein
VPAPASRHYRIVTSRILIVDDSPPFRAAVAELLIERGFEVLVAVGDGDEALAAVAERCPDGILLDVNLPGRDGFSVAATLSASCPAARIVLTSAEVDYVGPATLETCTAVAFVPKQDLAAADLKTLFQPAGT